MKQTKNEITRETAPEYPDLDQALEQLAGEVPPMPSGLHEKWMNAVKTEAAKREEPETETGEKETAGKNRTGSMARLILIPVDPFLPPNAARSSHKEAAAVFRQLLLRLIISRRCLRSVP